MTTRSVTPERLLTRDQVAARLQVSVTYVRQTLEPLGCLRPVRIGRAVRIRERDVDELIRRLHAGFDPINQLAGGR